MGLRLVRDDSQVDRVFRKLAGAIISGRHAPGAVLPKQDALADHFNVNMAVMREAFRKLEGMRLIQLDRRGAAKVLNFKQHSGLELLAVLAQQPTGQSDMLSVWLSAHRLRAVMAADAARYCASHGSPVLKQHLLELSRKMRNVGQGPELFELAARFWETVIDGSGNLVYRLAFNTLLTALSSRALRMLATTYVAFELKQSDYLAPIAEAIARGDADGAERETRRAMQGLVDAQERMLALHRTDADSSTVQPTKPR